MPADPTREIYEFIDPQARPGDHYQLFVVEGTLRGPGSAVVVPVIAPGRLQVAPAVPNPFNPRTVLAFFAPDDVPVRALVVDAQGRTVRTFAPAPTGDGRQMLVWEGDDDEGRPVASGTYHFVVRSATESQSTPVTLVR